MVASVVSDAIYVGNAEHNGVSECCMGGRGGIRSSTVVQISQPHETINRDIFDYSGGEHTSASAS